jgi:hypothetical protein
MDPFQATMEGLTRGLNVGHVATSPLSVAYPNQSVAEVRSWAGLAKINNVPVRLGDSIVGVIENLNGDLEPGPGGWPPAAPADGELVGSAKRDLATDMLIDASYPLLGVVESSCAPRTIDSCSGMEACQPS